MEFYIITIPYKWHMTKRCPKSTGYQPETPNSEGKLYQVDTNYFEDEHTNNILAE